MPPKQVCCYLHPFLASWLKGEEIRISKRRALHVSKHLVWVEIACLFLLCWSGNSGLALAMNSHGIVALEGTLKGGCHLVLPPAVEGSFCPSATQTHDPDHKKSQAVTTEPCKGSATHHAELLQSLQQDKAWKNTLKCHVIG